MLKSILFRAENLYNEIGLFKMTCIQANDIRLANLVFLSVTTSFFKVANAS